MKIDVWEFKDNISVKETFDFIDKISEMSDISEEELKKNPKKQFELLKQQFRFKMDFLNENRVQGPTIDENIETKKLNEIFTKYQQHFLAGNLG